MSWRRLVGALWIAAGATWLALVGFAQSRATLRPPPPTTMLYDRTGAFLGEIGVGPDERLGFWPAGSRRCAEAERLRPDGDDCLPERIVAATLAIEDARFDAHPGVDPRAVGRALAQNLGSAQRISGASTIAMQVARLQDPGPRTWPRKAVEALTALLLVDRVGRDAVLAAYLQRAPYGNNVHGVRYAARRLFRKPLADLTWAEASLLASLPQAPGAMNPYEPAGRRRAIARAERVLDRLVALGTIDADTRERAGEELAQLRFGARPTRPEAAIHPVLALDATRAGGGPERVTTLDLALQERVEQLMLGAVVGWRDRGAEQAAALVLDRRTLAVRAAVGSIGFDGTHAGAIDFTRTPRTPGSTLKPLLYAYALDRGALQPAEILDDLTHGPEGLRNADDDFLGPMLPRTALANSRNVPAVALAERVGLDALFGFWGALGLHDGKARADRWGLGIAIGGMPVRAVDLAVAYGALANDGVLRPLTWFDGEAPEGEPVISPEHARLVTRWLADPVARQPTFPRGSAGDLPFPVALKTGTSPDHRDAWTVAWDDRHLVVVWVGHPDWRPMRGLTGHRAAGDLAHRLLVDLHDGRAVELPAPDGWAEKEVCAISGGLATPRCNTPRREWFAPGEAPAHDCAAHVQDGARVALDLPARYGSWLTRRGLPRAVPVAPRDAPVAVEVRSPEHGARIARDPDVPADRSTLRLAASVDPPGEPVVFWVDGAPFAVAHYPYEVRWPVQPGRHTFEARLAGRPERSRQVTVDAR